MLSTILTKVLILEYVVICGACVWEHNACRAIYWLGAVILNLGILWGMK